MRGFILPMLILSFAALTVPVLAQRSIEEGSASVTETCKFTVARTDDYQREVWIGFCATDVAPDQIVSGMGKFFASTISVAALHRGYEPASTPRAADKADTSSGLERVALAAGFDGALKKLGVGTASRKHTRVVAVAFYESCVDALALASTGAIDADGLVLINPPIAELPQVATDAKAALGVDVFMHPRSVPEGLREQQTLLERLGPYAHNARVLQSFQRDTSVGMLLQEVWDMLRGYSIVDVKTWTESPDARIAGHTSRAATEQMIEALADYDVVFLGELHGNAGAHAMQYDLLKGLSARWVKTALVTEHFERDTQSVLAAYLSKPEKQETANQREEAEKAFLKGSRPWPNHADYRPMVEFCREKSIPVIAGNVPRRLAARVNKDGPEAFEKFSEDDKFYCAAPIIANEGAYKDKFFEIMGSSTDAKRDDEYARLDRMYAAQCLKDDTMAQSTLRWLKANMNGKVIHINGAFHSAGGLGVPEKLKLANPALKIAIVTCIEAEFPPSQSLDAEDATGNDFVVFVPASRPTRKLKNEADGTPSPHK